MMKVPILLTCDIHTHECPAEQVRQDMAQARPVLRELGLPCTFFFPSKSAQLLREEVDALVAEGHEIGCHGFTHDYSEQYSVLPLAEQRWLLGQATADLTSILGKPPTSFRAPVFKVSGHTMRVLDELGYWIDTSVPSQRLSVFGSDLYNLGPLVAPRRPYHPSWESAYRRGSARVWEAPVSAWMLPFLSNAERLIGLPLMKAFFHGLCAESRVTGKPIVFMFHVEDFNAARGVAERPSLSWRDFLPSRTRGFWFRLQLMERDWSRVRRDLIALLQCMAGTGSVEFLTASAYAQRLSAGQPAGHSASFTSASHADDRRSEDGDRQQPSQVGVGQMTRIDRGVV